MPVEIYFDDEFIDPDNYLELTQDGTLFDKEFKLGATLNREFKLTIPKSEFREGISEVIIKRYDEDYAHLIIDDYEFDENSGVPTATLTLCDKMVLANFNYDASPICPTTVKGILLDICSKIGVELGNEHFDNEDEYVDFYDNTIQAREYISYIAECAGGFARIEADGKLWIRYFDNDNTKSLNGELCEKLIIGQRHDIRRVVFDNGLLVFKSNYEDEEMETLYLNPNNPYINTQDQFNAIADKILGFTYFNSDTGKTAIIPDGIAGDVIKMTYYSYDYYTILQPNGLKFMGDWEGEYKLDLESNTQKETKVNGYNEKIRGIKVNQNRIDNILQIAVQDIDYQKQVINNKLISQINANATLIEQTSKEINQSVTEITGILSKDINNVNQDLIDATKELNGKIAKNTTLIQQLASAIVSTIKTTGGNNLLRNSVGYAGTDFWEFYGDVNSGQDTEVEENSVSGSKFILQGASYLKQEFSNQMGLSYGISFKIKHTKNGNGNAVKIRIHRTVGDTLELLSPEEQVTEYSTYTSFDTFLYTATSLNPTIEIINEGNDILEITDLMVSIGDNQSWSGYFDEVYGKEHRLDKYGLKLSDLASNDYSKQTARSLVFVDDEEVVGEISGDKVKSSNGEFNNSYKVRNLKTIAIDDSNVIEYVE